MYKHSAKIRQTETWGELHYTKATVPENISVALSGAKTVPCLFAHNIPDRITLRQY